MERSREVLDEIIKETQRSRPFKIDAWVLLPDHFHSIWTLPENDSDYSKRWGLIKAAYTKRVGKTLVEEGQTPSESRIKHREGLVWQRRFWEHRIRDEKDYETHCDYIHYNPVKHGLTSAPKDWPHSSFNTYVDQGIYSPGWGSMERIEFPEGIGAE